MKQNNKLNNQDPAPLYHQIAAEIRRQIKTGRLAPGDALAPLREAAEQWGVHLHTVRHAYAALAREGLVESRRGPQGTRVARDALDSGHEDVSRFVGAIVKEARERWSLTPSDLAAAIEAHRSDEHSHVVHVVECSEHQCQDHAREIQSAWDVDAQTWTLSRDGDLPDGNIVATYFHYNDIRRRWPLRLQQVHFVSISPDPQALQISRDVRRVIVCETDRETAEAVAADVRHVVGESPVDIIPRVVSEPGEVMTLDDDVVFVSPRLWAALSPADRATGRVREVRYIFDENELRTVAHRLSWPTRALEGKEA